MIDNNSSSLEPSWLFKKHLKTIFLSTIYRRIFDDLKIILAHDLATDSCTYTNNYDPYDYEMIEL